MCSFERLQDTQRNGSKALHYPLLCSWNEGVKKEKNAQFTVSLSGKLAWYSFPFMTFVGGNLCTMIFHVLFWISFIVTTKGGSVLLWGCFSRHFWDICASVSLIFNRPGGLRKLPHGYSVTTLEGWVFFLSLSSFFSQGHSLLFAAGQSVGTPQPNETSLPAF